MPFEINRGKMPVREARRRISYQLSELVRIADIVLRHERRHGCGRKWRQLVDLQSYLARRVIQEIGERRALEAGGGR